MKNLGAIRHSATHENAEFPCRIGGGTLALFTVHHPPSTSSPRPEGGTTPVPWRLFAAPLLRETLRMKNLYQPAATTEIKQRIAQIRPDSARHWGKMNSAQALAHCAGALEIAVGDTVAPRMFVGRIIGGLIKSKVVGDDKPLRRNSPTMPTLIIVDECDLQKEQARLATLVDRFATTGPSGCTRSAHSFFGRMTPDEWAILMYKHLDHHLRQFGV